MGGIGVEIFRDVAIGLPPLNQTLARRIMEETKVYPILKGFRNMPPANLKLLEEIMVRFSQMLVDFPQIKEVDINPLIIDEKEAFALDARVVIDKEKVFGKLKSHQHLVISPYPKKYESLWTLRDGRAVILRPIRPEDEPLWQEMIKNCSEKSIYYRFFCEITEVPPDLGSRCCNIDYDREIAIVAELTEDGKKKILSIGRVLINLNEKSGDLAFMVADPWQGLGLGSKITDYFIEISKEKNLETLTGLILKENFRAIHLMEKMGFTIEDFNEEKVKASLNLKEESN